MLAGRMKWYLARCTVQFLDRVERLWRRALQWYRDDDRPWTTAIISVEKAITDLEEVRRERTVQDA
jgi:hypothetical protein